LAAPPAPPLLLASTSPRRKQILEQLRVPFDVVAPRYEETEDDPVAHAVGKARSVLAEADGRPVLGCDTEVVCAGRVYGKPTGVEGAEEMLESLSGRTHEVVSGLALVTPAWEEVHREVTLVAFRELTPRDIAWYVGSGEWEGRAGGLAVDPSATHHLGFAAQHRTPVRLREHRSCLAEGVRDRILLRLLVFRCDDLERDPELLEDLPPTRRRRG